jgi:K+-sensing histidine kinase KdpD
MENSSYADALLADIERTASKDGRLFIFLGMCPGVGKTYAMLQTARQRVAEGVDVLAGVIETHGRSETAALLEGMTRSASQTARTSRFHAGGVRHRRGARAKAPTRARR